MGNCCRTSSSSNDQRHIMPTTARRFGAFIYADRQRIPVVASLAYPGITPPARSSRTGSGVGDDVEAEAASPARPPAGSTVHRSHRRLDAAGHAWQRHGADAETGG